MNFHLATNMWKIKNDVIKHHFSKSGMAFNFCSIYSKPNFSTCKCKLQKFIIKRGDYIISMNIYNLPSLLANLALSFASEDRYLNF